MAGPTEAAHGLRRQAITESLLADVVHGRLRAGEHLVTQRLADRFGVSHTPIREALISLAGLGLVQILPNRGAAVKAVTPRDVREVLQVRRLLECQAARSACGRIPPEELRSLKAELRELLAGRPERIGPYLAQARRVDSRLHDLIATHCGNAFLAQELGRLTMLFRAFRDLSYTHHEAHNERERLREEASEHLAIVEALIAHSPNEASRAMARHIRSGIRTWSRAALATLAPPGGA
jgi:DNA-binding GntR family transcriptional regulator